MQEEIVMVPKSTLVIVNHWSWVKVSLANTRCAWLGWRNIFLSIANILPQFVTLHKNKQFLCSFLHSQLHKHKEYHARCTCADAQTHRRTDAHTDKLFELGWVTYYCSWLVVVLAEAVCYISGTFLHLIDSIQFRCWFPHRTKNNFPHGALHKRNLHLRTGNCGRTSGANTATVTFNFQHPRVGGSSQATEYNHGFSTRKEMWYINNPINH